MSVFQFFSPIAPIHDGSLGWSTVMGHHVKDIVASDGLVGSAMVDDGLEAGFHKHTGVR